MQDRVTIPPEALLFAGFDANQDCIIDAAEIEAGILVEFARADSDRDGVIALFEFRIWSEGALGGDHAPRRLDIDRNVDNSITAEEFAAELRARAADFDANHDTRLVRAEFIRRPAEAERGMEGAGAPRGGMRRRGRRPGGGGPRQP